MRPPGFGGLAGSPLILGDKLILNGSPGGMALDAKTGKTLWKSGDGPGGHASPVPLQIRQKTYLAIHSPRALTIVDAADGKEVWTTPRRQPIGVNAPDPVVDGTKVFVTAGRAFGGALFDVSGDTTPLWEQEGLSSHWHTSVLLNGYLFGPDGNNSEGAGRSPTSLRCLDWKTGEIKWTEPKLGFNGLIAVGGKLLVLTETGDLVLAEASPEGYKELGSAHVIEGRAFTAPVFANGKAYARNTRGDVVCLDFEQMTGLFVGLFTGRLRFRVHALQQPAPHPHPDVGHNDAGNRTAVFSRSMHQRPLSRREERLPRLRVLSELGPAGQQHQVPVVRRPDTDLASAILDRGRFGRTCAGEPRFQPVSPAIAARLGSSGYFNPCQNASTLAYRRPSSVKGVCARFEIKLNRRVRRSGRDVDRFAASLLPGSEVR